MTDTNRYIQRINRVMDYVYTHPAEDLSLAVLARVACFSPYHFHRLFRSLTGESVNEFVKRARLERAVMLLRASPELRLSRVAFDCGFTSLSDFSRSFKHYFLISPGRWDRRSPLKNSKICQADGEGDGYLWSRIHETIEPGEMTPTVERMPELRLAYVRITNPIAPGNLAAGYERLKSWLAEHDLALSDRLLIGIMPDDHDVTPPEKLRYDFCASVDRVVESEGEINVRVLPATTVVRLRCTGDLWEVTRAWEYLYRSWLPRSAYEPTSYPAMEIYRRTPDELGWETYDIDCCIPIEPLTG